MFTGKEIRSPEAGSISGGFCFFWLPLLFLFCPSICTVQFLHHEGYLRAADQRKNRAAFDRGCQGILRNEGTLYSDNIWLQNIPHEMDVRLLQYNRRTWFFL
jgi:hypothetical protein